ncbi:hypothetical protein COLU111180_11835 [Cohnella lubricantis]|uniref:Uncharacterized protein n=1 Tax=Cohnella lubricantis TaxID=2163172 RepID=A0A841T9N1_9BACL|nr:hypothetical protein [Cohnella lubricantis]MBB6676128.1 hypothetical protein [Cohnella lubricantis]MBP2118680.1 hypothetical protein [Cohnella lubricantis]
MDLEQALAAYVGRSIEAISPNSFVQGTLLGTGSGLLSIEAVSSGYTSPSGPVSVPIANLSLVRVLAA